MSVNEPGSYFDLKPLLDEVVSQHGEAARARETGLDIEFDPSLPRAFGNPVTLRRILAWLGRLSLETVRNGERVRITARALPTGTHIAFNFPPSPAVHLTFQTTPGIIEKRLTPAGILSMSDNIVLYTLAQKTAAAHGMKVWLDQDPLIARLNVYIHDYGMMAQVERKVPLVLVIEDVVPIGTLLEYYLNHAGFQTMHAYNGESGIEEARTHVPDLITLDVWMPSMDGLEVLNTLKADERTRRIPVVLITVLPNRLVGYERGASDYLQKPVMREDVIECAQRLTRLGLRDRPVPSPSFDRVAAIGRSPAFADELRRRFPQAEVKSFDLHNRASLALIADGNAPELVCIEHEAASTDSLATALRFALLEQLANTPILGVATDGNPESLRDETCAFHGILPLSELSHDTISAALAP